MRKYGILKQIMKSQIVWFPVYFNGKPRIAILIQNYQTELQGRAHFTIWIPQTHGLFFPTLLTPIIACAESILNLVKYCHILEFGFNPFPYPFQTSFATPIIFSRIPMNGVKKWIPLGRSWSEEEEKTRRWNLHILCLGFPCWALSCLLLWACECNLSNWSK